MDSARSYGVHTCHSECPCHTGGEPTPDFIGPTRRTPVEIMLNEPALGNTPPEPTETADYLADLHEEQCAHGQTLLDLDRMTAERDRLAAENEELRTVILTVVGWDPAPLAIDLQDWARARLVAISRKAARSS